MSYFSGVVSDRTRLLHGALQLTTFTVDQLAELTGIKPPTVQSLVAHSRDLMEVVTPGDAQTQCSATLYRLRESGRARVAREAIELTERLRGQQPSSISEIIQTATVVLDAAEASVELGESAGDRRIWEERAVVQLELARRLTVLVKDYDSRASLRRRVVKLAGQLEGIELRAPAAPPQRAPVHELRKPKGPRTIWRSPNRRLYDATERRFITLEDIRKLVSGSVDFVVIDKRGRGDITRSILLQILAELEGGEQPVMSREFLSDVIRAYGSVQGSVGSYLELTLKLFAGGQGLAGGRDDMQQAL
jgi:polyhydroxyalkanoate synthesis repressor PhaR